MNTVRIWDLPTRLFHWTLALAVFGLIVTGKIGTDALVWHGRLGYVVLTLLLFRLLWGVAGGRWSRFGSFVPSPRRLSRYLRGQATPEDTAGHNPLGAFSVLAMLLVLSAQAGTGLFADDEIAFTGPLVGLASGSTVAALTSYHKGLGQWLVIGLVTLHLAAIGVYALRGHGLVRAMVSGDKTLDSDQTVRPSADGAAPRAKALVILALAAGAVAWLVNSAPPASLGF